MVAEWAEWMVSTGCMFEQMVREREGYSAAGVTSFVRTREGPRRASFTDKRECQGGWVVGASTTVQKCVCVCVCFGDVVK